MTDETKIIEQLEEALAQPDENVPEPKRNRQSSFTSQIIDLTPGNCAVRAERFADHLTLSYLQDKAEDARTSLRNAVSASIKGASAKTGLKYNTEIVTLLTPKGKFIIQAVVTIADASDTKLPDTPNS